MTRICNICDRIKEANHLSSELHQLNKMENAIIARMCRLCKARIPDMALIAQADAEYWEIHGRIKSITQEK